MVSYFSKLVGAVIAGLVAWIVSQDHYVGISTFLVFLVFAYFNLYKNYVSDNPKHYWFKRKLFGWGWVPATWEGWAVTLGYIVLVLLFALTVDESSPPREQVFTFYLPLVLLTLTLLRIAYKKGEKPKWQWGEDLDKYEK